MEKKEPLSQEQIEEYILEIEKYNSREEVKADMHNHTRGGSDGDDSPLMLLLRAHNMGLKTVSLTDHNSINGYRILQEQIEKAIAYMEDIDSREDLSETEKEKIRNAARRLLKIIEEVHIVTGCEVLTIFKSCPYVEILAYGVDIYALEKNLNQARAGLDSPGEVICKGLKQITEKYGIKADTFFMENRNDYRKMFFHELIRHPENAYLYETIEGETEEEKAANFAKMYLDNPESDFYVDLNSKTRKSEIQKMIQRHDGIVFDQEIIEQAGSAAGEFYIELLKHPENRSLIDERITSLRKFNYLGLYNEKSLFFVDLSTTKPSLEDVIKAIHDAGGKALVAHWGRYMLSNEEVFNWETEEGRKNLEEIIDMCDGAECAYPDNSLKLRKFIYDMCREKGKMISIGGDNHGKKGKEGNQYQLGSQNGIREIDGLEWIKSSVISGKDFLSQIEEEYQFKKRLKRLVDKKIEMKTAAKEQGENEKEQGE